MESTAHQMPLRPSTQQGDWVKGDEEKEDACDGGAKRAYVSHDSKQLRVIPSLDDLDDLERCMVDER